tara:strand:+ start:932 stop:1297 length:366 start_codon:yes stop_codon:yes gene_type:complete
MGMKNDELKQLLRAADAAFVERITHFDGDNGHWVVKNAAGDRIETGVHENALLTRLESCGVTFEPLEHPEWQASLRRFESKNEAVLESGGGIAHKLADAEWAKLAEFPGENLKRIVWDAED